MIVIRLGDVDGWIDCLTGEGALLSLDGRCEDRFRRARHDELQPLVTSKETAITAAIVRQEADVKDLLVDVVVPTLVLNTRGNRMAPFGRAPVPGDSLWTRLRFLGDSGFGTSMTPPGPAFSLEERRSLSFSWSGVLRSPLTRISANRTDTLGD